LQKLPELYGSGSFCHFIWNIRIINWGRTGGLISLMNERRAKLLEVYRDNKIKGMEILLDNLSDPHNVGAITRTADGFGINDILLYYTYNECPEMKCIGFSSSSGANKWLNYHNVAIEQVKEKKAQGYRMIATYIDPGAVQLTDYVFPEKCLIMMGSEHQGLSPELKELADDVIYIPMVGMVESFNVSVAASLFLYEMFRQKSQGRSFEKIQQFRGKRQ
jgi:tRNA (guanosine-2'-O-)-methyltransferase